MTIRVLGSQIFGTSLNSESESASEGDVKRIRAGVPRCLHSKTGWMTASIGKRTIAEPLGTDDE